MSFQEKKILNFLIASKSNLTATAIGNHVSEPRTTVNFYLKKLLNKDWVKKIKSPESQYPLWCLNDKSNFKNTILDFFALIGITPTALTTATIKDGYEQVKAAYEKILDVGKTERVFVIQGNRAPSATLKNLSIEFIEKMHAVQKQKPIILEGITSHKGLLVFDTMTARELQSHYGRLTVVYLIPDVYLDFDAEIFVFRNDVIVIQPATAKSLIIQDENTAQALKMLIEFIKQYAEKIDVNAYIKELIEKVEKINS